jgi:hypothetical protein
MFAAERHRANDCRDVDNLAAQKRVTAQQTGRLLLVLLLVALGLWPASSRAQVLAPGAKLPRRPVAVIDLASTPESTALANQFASELATNPRLVPISDATVAAAMVSPLQDLSADSIANANRAVTDAEDSLSRFATSTAIAQATAGMTELLRVDPSPAHLQMYWQLAFLAGRAALTDRNSTTAARWFRLASRVAPEAKPDPARYVSSVIAAFQNASQTESAPANLTVQGEGVVWIDGTARGVAPLKTSVEQGPHLVHLIALDRLPTGAQIDVAAAGATIVLTALPATTNVTVLRLRQTLQIAPDATARASAMAMLARLSSVQDAILIAKQSNNALTVASWSLAAPGFSKAISLADTSIAETLDRIAPPPPVSANNDRPPDIVVGPRRPKEVLPPWYRRRWVQGTVAGSAALVAVGLVMALTYTPDRREIEPTPEWR